MKYSIIIPTLNEEKLLPKLLEQLINSRIREMYDYEIIISDGGSSDATVEIALKYADKVIVHNSNQKQNIAEGRNKGAENANGDILIFLNGDIMIKNIEIFFKEIETEFLNSNYLAMTSIVCVNPDESKLTDKLFLGFYNLYFHSLNIIGVGMGRGEIHIIKKEVFQSLNGYNINLAAGEDFDLYKRIRRKGKILFDRKIIIYESPRRYRRYGHLKIFFTWLFNSIYVIFTNKSLSQDWEQVR